MSGHVVGTQAKEAAKKKKAEDEVRYVLHVALLCCMLLFLLHFSENFTWKSAVQFSRFGKV